VLRDNEADDDGRGTEAEDDADDPTTGNDDLFEGGFKVVLLLLLGIVEDFVGGSVNFRVAVVVVDIVEDCSVDEV
jgi:hypothetical protein